MAKLTMRNLIHHGREIGILRDDNTFVSNGHYKNPEFIGIPGIIYTELKNAEVKRIIFLLRGKGEIRKIDTRIDIIDKQGNGQFVNGVYYKMIARHWLIQKTL